MLSCCSICNSATLSCRLLSYSPMYCTGHFLHHIQYTLFFVWQSTCCVISAVNLEAATLTFFPCLINGQVGHPLHLLIPGIPGVEGAKGGTFALTIWQYIWIPKQLNMDVETVQVQFYIPIDTKFPPPLNRINLISSKVFALTKLIQGPGH